MHTHNWQEFKLSDNSVTKIDVSTIHAYHETHIGGSKPLVTVYFSGCNGGLMIQCTLEEFEAKLRPQTAPIFPPNKPIQPMPVSPWQSPFEPRTQPFPFSPSGCPGLPQPPYRYPDMYWGATTPQHTQGYSNPMPAPPPACSGTCTPQDCACRNPK